MNSPFLARPEVARAESSSIHTFVDYDDDDDDAADDDDDDLAASSAERWFTSPGFGSPEWWSRH